MCVEQPTVCNECLKLDQNWTNPCPHWRMVHRITDLEKKNIELMELINNIATTKCGQYCDICYEEFGIHCAVCGVCLDSNNLNCTNKKCRIVTIHDTNK